MILWKFLWWFDILSIIIKPATTIGCLFVIALFHWLKIIPSQVPFPIICRFITALLQLFGKGHYFSRQILRSVLWHGNLFIWTPVPLDEICYPHPCRILAGLNACPRRGANRTCSIGIVKPHTLLGKLAEVWSLVELVSIYRQIRPAKVICQDENNIWLTILESYILTGTYQKNADNENDCVFHNRIIIS